MFKNTNTGYYLTIFHSVIQINDINDKNIRYCIVLNNHDSRYKERGSSKLR